MAGPTSTASPAWPSSCLTGAVPFKRDQEIAVAMAHVRDRPPAPTSLRPRCPAAVDVVFAQAMAKDREARYATCSRIRR